MRPVVVADEVLDGRRSGRRPEAVLAARTMASVTSTAIGERLRALSRDPGKVYVAEGEDEAQARERCEAELSKARRIVERAYEAPLLSHSPMEPMNGLRSSATGRAELWVPTQVQSELRTEVAKRSASTKQQ